MSFATRCWIFMLVLPALVISSFSAGAHSDPTAADPPAETLTLEDISAALNHRLNSVHDVSARINFTQFSAKDGSKSEGELQVQAVFPHLVRATWVKPEIYSGVFFIMDSHSNVYTEYIPAMGEAHRLPLDEVVGEKSPIQLSPHQLFMLPEADDFDLDLIDSEPRSHAVIQAVERTTQKVYLVTVDTVEWFVTHLEERAPDGRVERSADVHAIEINQDLSAASLRLLPPGTIEKSYP